MKSTELKEEGVRLMAGLLAPAGWQRTGRQPVFAKDTAPGIQGRLNFNCVLRNKPACVHVTPYAEIVHQEVESVRQAITGKRYYTINTQIQSLMGDVDAHWRWIFSEDKEIEPVASRIVADALSYGEPFIRRFETLGEITRGLESLAKGERSIMRQSVAICYCLQGRQEEAVAALSGEIEAARADPHEIAHERLRKYADIFSLPISV